MCGPPDPYNKPTVKYSSLYSSYNPPNETCQLQLEGKIVGGVSAIPHEFPHQIRLINGQGETYCSGTIINALFILTAAHCLKYKSMRVVAGDHEITLQEGSEQYRDVLNYYYPEDYNSGTLENDIALLELSQPLEYNQYVKSTQFPMTENQTYRDELTVSGWGRVKENGPHSDILQKVSLSLVPYSICEKSYRYPVRSGMFCAYSPCKDACKGDSGGPVLCTEKDSNKTVVCGIVSWGVGCARLGYPGVYTNVSHYWQWIEKEIKQSPSGSTKNCKNLFEKGNTRNGVYTIQPNWLEQTSTQVYCDMEKDGGGWTIIQRRGVRSMPKHQRESFYRNWTEYENGFGSADDDYWIGLKNIHILTSHCENELKITLTMWTGTEEYAGYSNFQVAGGEDDYKLSVSGWTGGSLYELRWIMHSMNGMKFSTFDRPSDRNWRKCAERFRMGAWWWNYDCAYANLNGEYADDGSNGLNYHSFHYHHFIMVKEREEKRRPGYLRREERIQDCLRREERIQDCLRREERIQDCLRREERIQDYRRREERIQDCLRREERIPDYRYMKTEMKIRPKC